MTRKKTPAVRTARRRAPGQRSLAARVAALEERLARLETGRPPPGDGRRAAPPPRPVRRCPGCGLPLRQLRGRCASCGRPID